MKGLVVVSHSPRKVVQVDLLRRQVHELIREDLLAGEFPPGSRLPEVELARRYSVSRTPVREALFQLASSGMIQSAERGYIVPTETARMAAERGEMRRLIDPPLVDHAARNATRSQVKALEKLFRHLCRAHNTEDVDGFAQTGAQFRTALCEMCDNQLLVRCSVFLDNQSQIARIALLEDPAHREFEIAYNLAILDSVRGQREQSGRTAQNKEPERGGNAAVAATGSLNSCQDNENTDVDNLWSQARRVAL